MKNGRIIINRNICDNAKECSGIEVCPVGALYWDKEKQEIAYKSTLCIDCGICAESCPVGAILWGCDDEDYRIKEEQVKNETRKLEELEVERYGASPIEPYIEYSELNYLLNNASTKYLLLELFNDESINCLLHSIRVSEIINLFEHPVVYQKVFFNNLADCKICKTTELPTLVVIKEGVIAGHVEGYYDDSIESKQEFFAKIKKLK